MRDRTIVSCKSTCLLIAMVFFGLFGHIVSAVSAEDVNWTPVPEWVSLKEIPKPIDAQLRHVSDGQYFRLYSTQRWHKGSLRKQFTHSAIEIKTRAGLEKTAKLSVTFSPEMDVITINMVRIHRGDEVIDLYDKFQFETIQQEKDLEHGILDGRLTAFTNLEDVRIGDIVEFARTVEYTPILLPNESFSTAVLNYGSPVGLLHYNLTVPVDRELTTHFVGQRPQIVHSVKDGMASHDIQLLGGERANFEKNMPDWIPYQNLVEFSSVNDWGEVAENSISHYVLEQPLPVEFTDKLDRIAAGAKDREIVVGKVLALIQQEIRYVGVEIGHGAFIPRQPQVVLKRGYGDCKDKSLLMVAALSYLDIPAVPALAHLKRGNGLRDRLPSPYQFDHVIVRVDVNGTPHFLDPTASAEIGPNLKAAQSNYGFALPISSQTKDLEAIEPFKPNVPGEEIHEKFRIDASKKKPIVELEVTSTYRDDDAFRFRRKLAKRSIASLQEDYQDYYLKHWPGMKSIEDMKINDDRETNVITMTEHYALDEDAKPEELMKKFYLRGDTVRSLLHDVSAGERQFPVKLPFPLHRKHITSIENLKENYTPPKSFNGSIDGIEFSSNGTFAEKVLKMEWVIKVDKPVSDTSELDEYRKLSEQINDETIWWYDFNDEFGLGGSVSGEGAADEATIGGLEAFYNKHLETIIVVAASVFAIAFFLYSFWRGMVWDRARAAEAIFYPVEPWKVGLMSVASMGLYASFWYFRFWRWEKFEAGKNIWPLPRALFFGLTAYAGVRSAAAQAEPFEKIGKIWILFSGITGVGLTVVSFMEEFASQDEHSSAPYLMAAFLILVLLTVLPVAFQVKRINKRTRASEEVLRKNSRFTLLNWIGLLLFAGVYYAAYFIE